MIDLDLPEIEVAPARVHGFLNVICLECHRVLDQVRSINAEELLGLSVAHNPTCKGMNPAYKMEVPEPMTRYPRKTSDEPGNGLMSIADLAEALRLKDQWAREVEEGAELLSRCLNAGVLDGHLVELRKPVIEWLGRVGWEVPEPKEKA